MLNVAVQNENLLHSDFTIELLLETWNGTPKGVCEDLLQRSKVYISYYTKVQKITSIMTSPEYGTKT